jgi:ATP-binding cassette subfamily F protein 3
VIIVSVEGIRKHYGPEPVLDGVTFEIRPAERIGLVGPNGTGKTTLLRILAGRDDADAGVCQYHPSVTVGYLEQQPEFAPDRTVWDEAHSALDALVALQHEAVAVAAALSKATDEEQHQRLAARYDHLQQELARHDAYNLEHKVERVLDGLGFARAVHSQPACSLSGGEQNRLMLARLLLAEPDLMLLDEPSNHLDIEGTQWLEEVLAASPAAMLMVSHDRYFLDRVTNRTLELFHGTVDSYTGNFSAYLTQKEERLLVARRTWERQQTEIAKTEDFIRRNTYGQKHAQAEDRRKKLARIERVDPPREIAPPPMRFPEAARSGDIVIRAEGVAKAFQRPLFSDVTIDILRGERWGLLGPNGSGKTTLLRCLLGLIEPDAGRVQLGQALEIGYFDQHLTSLDDNDEVADAVRPDRDDLKTQQRRDLLALFGVTGDTALQKVRDLSGGERCRAALARLAGSQANFLILDEPTNHLDLWARGALEDALQKFDGTVLFVSHDRYFIDRVADHLLVLEGGRVRVVAGNYTEYQRVLERAANGEAETGSTDGRRGQPAPAKKAAPSKPASKPASDSAQSTDELERIKALKRKFSYRKLVDIEAEIQQREARVTELHGLLAQPETHRDGDLVRQLMAEVKEHGTLLEQLYEHWELAAELNW